MKKFLWILGIISMLILANCGGDNSQKAKELLSRILTIIGIPYDIVVNICQDDNGNGICESTELQAKLTINKGDTIDDIWKKIAISDDGKYLLQHHDPTKKIIMEIKDTENVTHNNGEFALSYNPMTTELSILQYMIDTGHLTTDDVKAVREMNNVDEFYKVLLKDFETNLNLLQDKGLSADRAVLANSKEIAEELISNGIVEKLPKKINGCDGNQSCIDEELGNLSKELVVDENETETIKQEQTQITKELLVGKTFYSYYIGNDGKKHITEVKVNDNATSWSYKDIVGGEDSGNHTIEIDGDKLTIYYDDNTIEEETVIEREKYLAIGNMKFFYNRDDAQTFYNADTSSVDTNATSDNRNQKGFTKEMVLNKVVYDSFSEDNGSKVYEKMIFESETSILYKNVTISTEGKVINNETFSLSYIIENGKMKIEDDDEYTYLTLNSKDDIAWYVKGDIDIGKDGTIDESHDGGILYLSKPSDYPDEL